MKKLLALIVVIYVLALMLLDKVIFLLLLWHPGRKYGMVVVHHLLPDRMIDFVESQFPALKRSR